MLSFSHMDTELDRAPASAYAAPHRILRPARVCLAVVLLACDAAPSRVSDAEGLPDAGPGPRDRICDGTEQITLAYYVAVESGQLSQGLAFMYENGASFLYVDGRCRYWVKLSTESGKSSVVETRQGTLDESWEQRLSRELRYQELPRLALQTEDPPKLAHLSPKVVTDGQNFAVCLTCTATTDVGDVIANASRLIGDLHGMADPDVGPVRALASEASPAAQLQPPLPIWPSDLEPLTTFLPSTTVPRFGLGHYVDDPQLLSTLRMLRTGQEDLRFGRVTGIPVSTESGTVYELFFRAVIPYEDERGLIRLE